MLTDENHLTSGKKYPKESSAEKLFLTSLRILRRPNNNNKVTCMNHFTDNQMIHVTTGQDMAKSQQD